MTQEIKKNCNYIHDRAQKITEALYRVTEFFPQEEPLKWLLRERGVNIFNTTIKINGSSPHERIHFIDEVSESIPKMIKILELASVGAFISQANFEVLKREYSALCDFINSKREEFLPEPMLLTGVNLGEKERGYQASFTTDRQENSAKDDSIGQKSMGHSCSLKDTNGQSSMSDRNKAYAVLRPENKKNNGNGANGAERKEKIIDFIGKKGWVSVGEVANEVFDGTISSKTVQRDLTALTNRGALQKEGNKRWRRYGPNG